MSSDPLTLPSFEYLCKIPSESGKSQKFSQSTASNHGILQRSFIEIPRAEKNDEKKKNNRPTIPIHLCDELFFVVSMLYNVIPRFSTSVDINEFFYQHRQPFGINYRNFPRSRSTRRSRSLLIGCRGNVTSHPHGNRRQQRCGPVFLCFMIELRRKPRLR